jgi:SAM-dependent methyltransferase
MSQPIPPDWDQGNVPCVSEEIWLSSQVTYWNGMAQDYASLYSTTWYDCEEIDVANHLRAIGPTPGPLDVLDLGCGAGLGRTILRRAFGSRIRSYTGVDISECMIERAELAHPGDRFYVADAVTFMNEHPGRFDLVTALFTTASYLHCNPEMAISAALESLRPGGRLYLSFLNRYSLAACHRHVFRVIIEYHTRGDSGSSPGALARRTSSWELARLTRKLNLSEAQVTSLGPLVGLLQYPPLYRWNRRLKSLPMGHTIALTGKSAHVDLSRQQVDQMTK